MHTMAERSDNHNHQKSRRRKSWSGLLDSAFTGPARDPHGHDRSVSDGFYATTHRSGSRPLRAHHRQPKSSGRPYSSGSLIATEYLASPSTDELSNTRSKSSQKSMRKSVFGSLRSLGSIDDDQRSTRARSKASSGDEEDVAASLATLKCLLGNQTLHHGEVQTTGGMWRKKSQYLVLTDTHLVRFKSQSKAAELFPSIPASWGRNSLVLTSTNRQSMVSIASFQDPQLATYADLAAGIPLNSIVAVYKLDDGRPYFSIEVCHMDERSPKPLSFQLQFNDPEESGLWLAGIRAAAEQARAIDPPMFDQKSVEYVARALELERDYDPDCFRMYKVVQRVATKSGGRSSNDDFAKLTSNVCYLAIGVHKIHLIPLPKSSNRGSVTSITELDMNMSFGFMTLTSVSIQGGDDAFQLVFRAPLCHPFGLYLSSSFSSEIAILMRQRVEWLRPEWLQQPFGFNVPQHVEDQVAPLMYVDQDHGGFDRTLTAYCAAYDVDTSNIRYTIDYACDDAPCFRLLHPASGKDRRRYSALELLAVMRSLRYNESFVTISFMDINLDVLHSLRDPCGIDIDAATTRSNLAIRLPGQENMSILSQEIRALCLKNKRLRKLDFSFCLTRQPATNRGALDPGCGIPEAIFPLCRRQLTNVDWVVLNGIKLGDSDLDYLVDAASQKSSHLRALEVSHCGISIHDLDLILSTITAQDNTLESVDISGVQGRLSPELFQQQIGYFAHIRKINLSHISRTTGPEPLIAPETLLNWRLEELSLSHTAVNEQTVDSVAAYLASPRSSTLRNLRLDQCGLTGRDVAVFLHSMTNDSGEPRNIHLHVSENRLHVEYSLLVDAIANDKTPTHLTMRMMEFQKEDHFRRLLDAVRKNMTLKYLDISKASLPYDAGPETCKALRLMFEENNSIEELDISGEYAHLDVARFGIGLNQALTGLKKNTSLRVLKIEHQRLGLQGANTLASVLEENGTLFEVYCDNNEINLQSFTVLVNGLQKNKKLLHLPSMVRDREQCLERVRREIESVSQNSSNTGGSKTTTIRKTLQAAVSGGATSSGNKLVKPAPASVQQGNPHTTTFSSPLASSTPILASTTTHPHALRHDVQAVLQSLGQKWDIEVQRLQRYLVRNYNLAHGLADEYGNGADDDASDGRPTTAASLGTFLNQLSSEQTNPNQPDGTYDEEHYSSPENNDHNENLTIQITKTKAKSSTSDASRTHSSRPPLLKYHTSNGLQTSSTNRSVPTPSLPHLATPGTANNNSIRTTKSNSNLSGRATTSTPTNTGTRLSDTASSFRGLLMARSMERREQKKDRGPLLTLNQPPRLDWRLPDLEA
ncbi:leucine rich repeat domain-containing protein [Histoplasma capsulatum var. duboisii H88]|uniref:Leucine rich repeat domain-containing protein n=1 Tax=Ajellomyces capsulatus (strain H88) TaxID=544711 RepID=F0UHE9_AJEC8|nr:leucine rich repeat domain-containing protein [Histoplasma capsulatum var. duboisii H88]QSS48751.1 leucine rich repeat domain-containing protein [Histoplasma capsulatum var. duboisii H88]